mmetsp:Transcript_10975/g.16484  ORF Transcript_10975/g.16484 Transcript_10975/m.16484 type:complete len:443 (+) Transcript_10975:240-1568(+)|eukprot:CAMPEP_0196803118 /NCGR_PEP_ID=MMETSP1362-20130617/2541_1 /TAXON_ID=163516 /ORGANISM="Leptocylindrus danicus, Strain CCMP1856" /LENGTH=442 /DNA_ID=CAMNT_0042174559 /DNA_START=237 /DNA_END=1565 /DNA_ORIENTATION=+
MNVAVDVSFQDISIAHYTSGRNVCAGFCIGAGKRQHGGSDDFEYVYGGSESDWSSDDVLEQHQAHRQESSLLERICTGNRNIISEFKAAPTLYCIEYVAMISPVAAPQSKLIHGSPTCTDISSSDRTCSHDASSAQGSEENSQWFRSHGSTSTGGGNSLKFGNNAPMIIAGLRNWKVWRRYSDFKLLEQKFLDRVGPRVDGIFPSPLGNLPELPSKKFFGRFDHLFLAERSQSLQNYLTALMQCSPFAHSYPEVQEFFGIEECLGGGSKHGSSVVKSLKHDEHGDEDELRENMEFLLMAEEERVAGILDEAANLMVPIYGRRLSVEARQVQSTTARLAMDRYRKVLMGSTEVKQTSIECGNIMRNVSRDHVPKSWTSQAPGNWVLDTLLQRPLKSTPYHTLSAANNAVDSMAFQMKNSLRCPSRLVVTHEEDIVTTLELPRN